MARPEVSVVIAAYAYPAGLDRVLAALARQEQAPQFEVLVVDDGSPEPLEPVLEAYRGLLQVRYLRLANGGPARARNTGARAAAGEWIAFTDHDCEPAPDWLFQLMQEGKRSKAAALGGTRVTGLFENDWSLAHDLLCVFASQWQSDQTVPYFSTENLAVPRDRFLAIGGFDERFPYAHEDREFCERWVANGFEMRRAPAAVVRHSHAFSGRTFIRQHFRYGQGAADYHRIRNSAGPSWPWYTRFRFYAGLLGCPWKAVQAIRAVRISSILALSQGCYAVGYYSELRASRKRRQRSSNPRIRTSAG